MKEIYIEELKRIQVDILQVIHSFCISNDIRYTLHAGTLLGAVRHKGYIPWDDDIDIAMPRPDYNRFIQTFNGYTPSLVVMAPELDWNYYAPYANVVDRRTFVQEGVVSHRGMDVGIKIDIFPIDGVPDNLNEFEKQFAFINELNGILATKRCLIHKIPIRQIKTILAYLWGKAENVFYSFSSTQKRLHEVVVRYPFNESKFAATWVYCPVKKRLDKRIFEEYIDIPFEGQMFKSIKEYEMFLTTLYGDYMKLPPVDKQVPHHDFTAYWKD